MSDQYRICSWDVGIKNLAYCILVKDGDTYNIEHWDKIDVLDTKVILCCGKMKNGNTCNKRATFYSDYKDAIFYCGTHKSQYNVLKNEWSKCELKENTEKYQCEYFLPKKNIQCEKNAKYNYDDVNYCTSHKSLVINKKTKNIELKVYKKKKERLVPEVLGEKMYSKLNDIPQILNVDEVLIENQPTLKNPHMKTVSCFLMSYFVLRSKIDKIGTVTKIKFISPSNKLKVNDDQILVVVKHKRKKDDGSKNNEIYKLTKELAVKYTKILLKDDKKWLDHLEKYKKKDDLCDAYLQGYHYLNYKLKN